jgi:hypothetical protein
MSDDKPVQPQIENLVDHLDDDVEVEHYVGRNTGTKNELRQLALKREIIGLRMKAKGQNYTEIGVALGISKQGAARVVKRAYLKLSKEATESATDARTLDLHRLEQLHEAIWDKAMQAGKGQMGAVDRVLKLMERRSRLMGLDAPTKMEFDNRGSGERADYTEEALQQIIDDATLIKEIVVENREGGDVRDMVPASDEDAANLFPVNSERDEATNPSSYE